MGGRLDDKERNYDSSSYESRSDQETGQSLGRRKPRRSLFVDAMRPRAKVRVSIGSTDQDIHFCSFELQGHSISQPDQFFFRISSVISQDRSHSAVQPKAQQLRSDHVGFEKKEQSNVQTYDQYHLCQSDQIVRTKRATDEIFYGRNVPNQKNPFPFIIIIIGRDYQIQI